MDVEINSSIILFTLILQVFFFKDIKTKKSVSDVTHVEAEAPNMLRDKRLFVPFAAFILLHIGQWMYTYTSTVQYVIK